LRRDAAGNFLPEREAANILRLFRLKARAARRCKYAAVEKIYLACREIAAGKNHVGVSLRQTGANDEAAGESLHGRRRIVPSTAPRI
jgi:hypothetical protein